MFRSGTATPPRSASNISIDVNDTGGEGGGEDILGEEPEQRAIMKMGEALKMFFEKALKATDSGAAGYEEIYRRSSFPTLENLLKNHTKNLLTTFTFASPYPLLIPFQQSKCNSTPQGVPVAPGVLRRHSSRPCSALATISGVRVRTTLRSFRLLRRQVRLYCCLCCVLICVNG